MHHKNKLEYALYRWGRSTFESSIITRMQETSYVLMKLEPRIILKLFLNFSDVEPQYSYKIFSRKKSITAAFAFSLDMHVQKI